MSGITTAKDLRRLELSPIKPLAANGISALATVASRSLKAIARTSDNYDTQDLASMGSIALRIVPLVTSGASLALHHETFNQAWTSRQNGAAVAFGIAMAGDATVMASQFLRADAAVTGAIAGSAISGLAGTVGRVLMSR